MESAQVLENEQKRIKGIQQQLTLEKEKEITKWRKKYV
jgi:hypothetical protein